VLLINVVIVASSIEQKVILTLTINGGIIHAAEKWFTIAKKRQGKHSPHNMLIVALIV
jgi:hypothetical protein